jgi:hypothetical protein
VVAVNYFVRPYRCKMPSTKPGARILHMSTLFVSCNPGSRFKLCKIPINLEMAPLIDNLVGRRSLGFRTFFENSTTITIRHIVTMREVRRGN